MAAEIVTLKIGRKYPWWKDIYVTAVLIMHNIGLIEADGEVAANFVVRHSWFYTVDSKGRRRYVPMIPK